MFKLLAFALLALSTQVWSQGNYSNLPLYPCKIPQSTNQVNLNNSDDLFFAGRYLVRANRFKEGIQCLNQGKFIAPAYLDIRLELMYAFIEIGDQDSAIKEGHEFLLFPSNAYYFQTYLTYRRKIERMVRILPPIPGFAFISKPQADMTQVFRSYGEEIVHLDYLKEAVRLKNQARTLEARAMLDKFVVPFNPGSATVYLYSGLVYYDLNMPARAEKDLKLSLEYSGFDVDIILSVARALNAQAKYAGSLSILKQNIQHFNNYGCFQFGSALKDVYDHTNLNAAKKLSAILKKSLLDETADSRLCRDIENAFFR